jgi:uncharacterized membrane protein YhaH (DUF805 family)
MLPPSINPKKRDSAMDFKTAIKTCFSKYVDWNGRALRSEYWYFYLFIILGVIVTMILDAVTGLFVFTALFYLAVLLPLLFVSVRRLHDVGRNGWWMLISLIPIAGLVLLYWFIIEGDKGDNAFGPHPLGNADVGDTFS